MDHINDYTRSESPTHSPGNTFRSSVEEFTKVCGKPGKVTNKSWIKICRDCGLIQKGYMDEIAMDILWTKMALKNREMTIKDFRERLKTVTAPEYATHHNMPEEDAYAKLISSIRNGKPHLNRVSCSANLSHCADPSTYTGMHRYRFDKEGHPQIDKPVEYTGYVSGYKNAGHYVSSSRASCSANRVREASPMRKTKVY